MNPEGRDCVLFWLASHHSVPIVNTGCLAGGNQHLLNYLVAEGWIPSAFLNHFFYRPH